MNSWRWFRIGENSEGLSGLPWLAQASLYAGAVLAMPRHLLSLARPNLLEDPAHARTNIWNTAYRADNPAKHGGALCSRLAYNHSPDFFPFHPASDATSADALVYSAETHETFKFTGPATRAYQLHFARRLARLCQERGTRLVLLHTPFLHERGQTVISERELWPEVLGAPVDIVGVPPTKLFAGIPTADLPKLFFDDVHLNQNGQAMFTPLITPVLLQQYAASTNHN
jgi:hypothetical protein